MKRIITFLIFIFLLSSFSFGQNAGYSHKYIYDKNGVDIFAKFYYSWADWDKTQINTKGNLYLKNAWNKPIRVTYYIYYDGCTARCNSCYVEAGESKWLLMEWFFKKYKVDPSSLGYQIDWEFVESSSNSNNSNDYTNNNYSTDGIVEMDGEASCTFDYPNKTIDFNIEKIVNKSRTRSGTLLLSVALNRKNEPYKKGMANYKIAKTKLDPLESNYAYNNLSRSLSINSVPSGEYRITLVLSEYQKTSSRSKYVIVDYVSFDKIFNVVESY